MAMGNSSTNKTRPAFHHMVTHIYVETKAYLCRPTVYTQPLSQSNKAGTTAWNKVQDIEYLKHYLTDNGTVCHNFCRLQVCMCYVSIKIVSKTDTS